MEKNKISTFDQTLFKMKRLMLFMVLCSLSVYHGAAQVKKKVVAPAAKTELKKGNIEVKISYYFNEAQGQKADVGAKVHLFKSSDKAFKKEFINYVIGSMQVAGTDEIINSDYSEEADITGTVKLLDIPYGKYMLVVASKGRKLYSKKEIEINSPNKIFVKNFGYVGELNNEGEAW